MFRLVSLASKTSAVSRRMMATYKTSTGLAGLAVDPNGRETLINLSNTALKNATKLPENIAYRTHLEKWFSFINKTATDNLDIKTIEDKIELGQIEEVIEMTKNELVLIDYYYENKVWESVAKAQQEADVMVEEMKDSLYFTSPEARGATRTA